MKKNFFRKYLAVYLVVLFILAGFVGGVALGQRFAVAQKPSAQVLNQPEFGQRPDFLNQNVDFKLWQEVLDIIKKNYIDRDQVVDTQMFYGALRGTVDSLGDQHTNFFDPQETKDFSLEMNGNFEGIGAEIGLKKDQLIVVSPLPNSPAYNAGIKSGDKIYAIDDKPTSVMNVDEAVRKIRGAKGTKVKLLIGRDGWAEAKNIEIIRDEIHFDSVRYNRRDDQLFYVEVSSFNQDTMDLFNKAVTEIIKDKPKGIILDLRGNPGGYLDQAISLASLWVEDGPITFESYDGQKKPSEAVGRALLKDYPTVVLVNGGSASGSEIVAGALQDYGKAKLVGEKTFGKGSVQELKSLSDGSSIKITIARWLTPSGRSIDKEGVAPDIEIKRTQADYDTEKDPQLVEAVKILLEKK